MPYQATHMYSMSNYPSNRSETSNSRQEISGSRVESLSNRNESFTLEELKPK